MGNPSKTGIVDFAIFDETVLSTMSKSKEVLLRNEL
jgi:hypothetical protein